MADVSFLAYVIPIVLVVIGLLVYCICANSIYIVRQSEGIVVERFGRFSKVMNSGLHFCVPFVDTPRLFNWKKTHIVDGQMRTDNTSGYRIDLRENVFSFPSQDVYTRDTVALQIKTLMYYRIVDIKKAIYEVDDLQSALSNTAQTQLKEVFGNMTFVEALTAQNYINDHLRASFSRLFSSWGITVERMELLELSPHKNIGDVMKKQLMAERERRGKAIEAEGNKAAQRLEADGQRIVSMNMGLAEREATRKTSEGDAQAKVELARAESVALETVNMALKIEGSSRAQYFLAREYMSLFRDMVMNARQKVIYMPYVATGLSGLLASLDKVYGAHGLPPMPANKRVTRAGYTGGGGASSGSAAAATPSSADKEKSAEAALKPPPRPTRPVSPKPDFADLN